MAVEPVTDIGSGRAAFDGPEMPPMSGASAAGTDGFCDGAWKEKLPP
jgi:hypothetical protein